MRISALILMLLCASLVRAATHTAASVAFVDVSNKVAIAVAGDTVAIPSGTANWTGTLSVAVGVTMQGAGAIHSTNGGASTVGSDLTIITNNNPIAEHNLINVSVPAGQFFRLTGIRLTTGSAFATTQNGIIKVTGGTNAIRVDHCHFTVTPDSSTILHAQGGASLLTGVIDHNYFDQDLGDGPCAVYLMNGYSRGDAEWAAEDDFGSARFLFIEDNRWRNGLFGDANTGGQRFVMRYNSTTNEDGTDSNANTSFMANHGLTSGRGRGTRACEYYCNTNNALASGLNRSPIPINSGTALIWGNTVNQYAFVCKIDYTRKDNGTYPYGSPPTGWGNADGSTGTVWDHAGGYPALDQPGRGQGDLLSTNEVIADTVNTRTGTQAEVIQAISPVYIWANTFDPAGYGFAKILGVEADVSLVARNRDVYQQFGALGQSGSFNGTNGVGEGLLSARPSSGLTNNVGYWATDNQTLYVVTGPTTWATKYTPYTYPHPLQGATSSSAVGNLNVGRIFIRNFGGEQ